MVTHYRMVLALSGRHAEEARGFGKKITSETIIKCPVRQLTAVPVSLNVLEATKQDGFGGVYHIVPEVGGDRWEELEDLTGNENVQYDNKTSGYF